MLNILTGRAGSGKTLRIMREIRRKMGEGEVGMLLIVPEQYSHDAERRLCDVCGDALSLHAEVLSFTRLCQRVFSETGGALGRILDKSGQILVMHKALESLQQSLKVFGARNTRAEMLESLLAAVQEFKTMCVTPQMLLEMAGKTASPLSDKLRDFALIIGAYDALLMQYGSDKTERLTLLASKIGESSVGGGGDGGGGDGGSNGGGGIYFDGFNDFTAQEMRVIEELLKKGADVTVSLTCDFGGGSGGGDGGSGGGSGGVGGDESGVASGYAEIFEIPRRTVAQLSHMPTKVSYTHLAAAPTLNPGGETPTGNPETEIQTRKPELDFMEKYLFADIPPLFAGAPPQLSENSVIAREPATEAIQKSPVNIYSLDCFATQSARQGVAKTGGEVVGQSPPPPVPLPSVGAPLAAPAKVAPQDRMICPPDPPPPHPITILAAPSRYTECEYAAATIWEMIRAGYRWRDISVMARDFSQYEAVCGHVFEKYGIPYFSSGKADIQSKPPMALIDAALDIATMGMEYSSVFKYLKTGLLQLTTDEIAILENYALKWNIRGSYWLRDFTMPPSGYKTGRKSEQEKATEEALLSQLNGLRVKITEPLKKLRDRIKGESAAQDKLRSLYEFLCEISLPEQLSEKAEDFAKQGELRLADEYAQLLDIIIDALDQIFMVLGDSKLSAVEFRKMVALVMSQHDVGVIPISLDRTTLGGMAMSRRRGLKCLILLGATEENLPSLAQGSGALSDNERRILSKLSENIPSGLEERLYREMNMIYSTVTLPSDRLVMIYDKSEGRPSYIVKRLCKMFSNELSPQQSGAESNRKFIVEEQSLTEEQYLSAAEIPYMELQRLREPPIDNIKREHLSPSAAEKLYGKNLALSASGVDGFYSCPYRHFLQSGLKLAPRKPAEFDAATAGSFMHHVLEGVLCEIMADGKLKDIEDAELQKLASKYTEEYVKEVLADFAGKNARFEYLFRRYEQSVFYTLRDMVDELAKSQFEPIEFEMDISKLSKTERGYIDRVDAYEAGGKLYLRVVDYKTRNKAYEFDLGEVLYGKDMQMLIYLFSLLKHGKEKYGKNVEAAGVLYVPARDVVVDVSRNTSDEGIEKERKKHMRRSGLVLSDPAIIEAMESGEKQYLPVKTDKNGQISGESLVSGEQIETLAKHVEGKLREAERNILSGSNDCVPYKNRYEDACKYCEYPAVCRHDEDLGDKYRYAKKMTVEEVWEELGVRS